MAKLSKKQGDAIAGLYNTMNVARIMLESDSTGIRTLQGAELATYINRWSSRGYMANQALRAMGITPVGYDFIASNGA